ncbi:MAG: hypothetical protein WD960_00520 [Gemmatimonadota bacterium]
MRTQGMSHGFLVFAAGLFLWGCQVGDQGGAPELPGVVFEEVLTLGFEDAPTLPSEGGLIARDHVNGVLAFVDRRVPYEVIVFSENGEPLEVLGRRGDGPGEYDQIRSMAYDGNGRLWLISQGGMRADVLTPDREVEHSFTLDRRVVNIRSLGEVPMLAVTEGGEGPALAYLRSDGRLDPLEWGPAAHVDSELIAITTDRTERYWVTVPHEFKVFRGDVHGNWAELDLAEPEWFGTTYSQAVQEELAEMLDTRGATILLLEYDPDQDLLWITSGVPVSDVDASRVRQSIESGDPEVLRGLVSMLIDHVVVGVESEAGSMVADGRFDLRAISWASPWQYEVGDNHHTVVLTRPALLN